MRRRLDAAQLLPRVERVQEFPALFMSCGQSSLRLAMKRRVLVRVGSFWFLAFAAPCASRSSPAQTVEVIQPRGPGRRLYSRPSCRAGARARVVLARSCSSLGSCRRQRLRDRVAVPAQRAHVGRALLLGELSQRCAQTLAIVTGRPRRRQLVGSRSPDADADHGERRAVDCSKRDDFLVLRVHVTAAPGGPARSALARATQATRPAAVLVLAGGR